MTPAEQGQDKSSARYLAGGEGSRGQERVPAEQGRWTPPKDPTSDKGRYVTLLMAVADAGWVHRNGVAYCKLCAVEAGVEHEAGCPVDALLGAVEGARR